MPCVYVRDPNPTVSDRVPFAGSPIPPFTCWWKRQISHLNPGSWTAEALARMRT